ncbi:MAG: hypothetical protein U1E73_11330 [Planctomycetota bacterium]
MRPGKLRPGGDTSGASCVHPTPSWLQVSPSTCDWSRPPNSTTRPRSVSTASPAPDRGDGGVGDDSRCQPSRQRHVSPNGPPCSPPNSRKPSICGKNSSRAL